MKKLYTLLPFILSLHVCTYITAQPVTRYYYVNTLFDTQDNNHGDAQCTDGQGRCSLRAAIDESNADNAPSIIRFSFSPNVAPYNNPPYILSADYPVITAPLTFIDATDYNKGDIVLSGFDDYRTGLRVEADNCGVEGVTITNFVDYGLYLSENAFYNNIEENTITENGVGIYALGSEHQINDNNFANNHSHGLRLGEQSNKCSILNNEFQNNNNFGIWIEGNPDNSPNFENTISKNIFYCNGEEAGGGIYLERNANENIEPPIIKYMYATQPGVYNIGGTATPSATIEVYINKQLCTNCEGEIFYGQAFAESDGRWELKDVEANIGDVVMATATTQNNSTSVFSDCKPIIHDNDEPCINDITALQIPVSEDICDGEIACASTFFATDSSSPQFGNPLEDCNGNPTLYSGQDIWFTAIMPSSNNLLLRQRTGTDIDAVVEVYSGDCFQQLQIITCETFYLKPDYLVLKGNDFNLSKGDRIYFRVYDAKVEGSFEEGNIALSAHALPDKEADWVFCDSKGASFDPLQFIAIMDAKADEGDIADLINDMENDGAILAGICKCAPQQMILFDNDSYIEMEKRGKVTSNRARVDTTSYNYFIEDFFQDGQGTSEKLTGDNYNPDASADAVKVAVIDTGIDQFHPHLNKAVWQNPTPGKDCVPDDEIGFDFKNYLPMPEDIDGHGTAVNGIITFDFPTSIKLELINPKFFENNQGKLFNAVCGMYYGMEKEAAVMNLSWGLVREEVPHILKDVLDHSTTKDIILVTSAGNKGEDNDMINKYPANFKLPNLITVAAFENIGDTILPDYSNYGKYSVDIAAQGTAESAQFNSNDISTFSGTSIAAPFVTQTAAIIRGSFPHLLAEDVINCILGTADYNPNFLDKVKTDGVLDQIAAFQCAVALPALSVVGLPLEIEFINNQYIQLNWSYEGELNSNGQFNIYRSTDGKNWHQLTEQTLDTNINKFHFIDDAVEKNTLYYYQIEWIPTSGKRIKSNIQSGQILSNSSLKIYPNPVTDKLVNIVLPQPIQEARLTLTTLEGRILLNSTITGNKHVLQLGTLPTGIYLLVIEENGNLWREKLLITRQ